MFMVSRWSLERKGPYFPQKTLVPNQTKGENVSCGVSASSRGSGWEPAADPGTQVTADWFLFHLKGNIFTSTLKSPFVKPCIAVGPVVNEKVGSKVKRQEISFG